MTLRWPRPVGSLSKTRQTTGAGCDGLTSARWLRPVVMSRGRMRPCAKLQTPLNLWVIHNYPRDGPRHKRATAPQGRRLVTIRGGNILEVGEPKVYLRRVDRRFDSIPRSTPRHGRWQVVRNGVCVGICDSCDDALSTPAPWPHPLRHVSTVPVGDSASEASRWPVSSVTLCCR